MSFNHEGHEGTRRKFLAGGFLRGTSCPLWLMGLAALVDQFQSVGLQDALDLAAGVHRPRAGGIELHVGLPVFEGLTGLAQFLVGQSKIVVGVGVSGS